MAVKNKYVETTTLNIVGTLILDDINKPVICMEVGKGDSLRQVNVNLLDIIVGHDGENISLQFTEEKEMI